jgi:hypothetical protein
VAASNVTLPPNFDALTPGVCELRESVLVLTAGSPAQAAKLRQSLPQLLLVLVRQGFELTEIRVRLQPAQMSYRVESAGNPARSGVSSREYGADQPSSNAQKALSLAEELALTLPDTGVGGAARRLAARLRRRIAQTG